jgi:hypothetical protein
MICIGASNGDKIDIINQYREDNGITSVVVFSPSKFTLSVADAEHRRYADIIMYKYYYRLLQEIDHSTLIVINECLRTQNRYDLTYNCLRNYLNQTSHQIIFQNLPIIDTVDDFMVLFDFDTRSRWKKVSFGDAPLDECDLHVCPAVIDLAPKEIRADQKTHASYQKKKRQLIDDIGLKDPHTIPRNLYLHGGRTRLKAVEDGRDYVGRNNRFKLDRLRTYRDTSFPSRNIVFEFPHNFIDFSDFMTLSGQTRFEVLVTDLKVDQWYLERYRDWAKRVEDACSALQ